MTYLIVKQIEDDKGYIKGYKTVEELVRCKDCIHLYDVDGDHYECDFMDARYDENGYCHHGEREEK